MNRTSPSAAFSVWCQLGYGQVVTSEQHRRIKAFADEKAREVLAYIQRALDPSNHRLREGAD